MKAAIVAGIMFAGLTFASGASASQELAGSSGCLKCHAVGEKKVGPALKDVASAHKGKNDEAALVAKLSGGKDHPKVKASEEDVKKLVHWILSL